MRKLADMQSYVFGLMLFLIIAGGFARAFMRH